MSREAQRSRSMLRSYAPADVLTIANASCGTVATFLCLDFMAFDNERRLWIAISLLPLALVFDILDGYVARPRANDEKSSSAQCRTRCRRAY